MNELMTQSLCETMKVLCHVLSDDADGGSTMPASQFVDLYCYLARVDGDIDEEDIGRVVAYVRRVADVQDGAVNQFNLDSELCPQLHWFPIDSLAAVLHQQRHLYAHAHTKHLP